MATVTVDAPLWPSLVAMIDADPASTAVITPLLDTVATAGFALLQVTSRPVRVFPAASRSVAVACVDCPMVSDDVATATATEATGAGGGAATLTTAFALTPSTFAVIVAVPTPTPRTIPLADGWATPELDDVHVTARP